MPHKLDVEELRLRIRQQSDEIVHLDQFVRLNFVAFAKLTARFDAALDVSTGSLWFMGRLDKEPFCNVSFDDVMILLSLTWALFRQYKEAAARDKGSVWTPPETFTRKTQKYWVPLDKVVGLKAMCLEHL